MARCWVLPSLALIAVVQASPEAIATRLRGAVTSETTSGRSESPVTETLSEPRELRTQDVSSWTEWSESQTSFDDLDSWDNGRYHHHSTTVRGHTFSCGVKGQDRTLAGMLLKAATQHFKENIHRLPSYKKVGLPAQYLCDSVRSIYNAVHAPEWKNGLASPQAPEYFQQADRESCNIAAVAVAASIQNPVRMLGYLSDLYFNGEITTVSPPVKPRAYILDMDPNNDIKCPDCQTGPIFVWTTALRDTRNQIILSTFSENDRETMEKFSFITISPSKGTGTQGGDGASYFATAQDEHFWAQQLLSQPKWTQGDCDGEERCQDLLSDFLPYTLAGLTPYIKSLKSGHPNWYHGPSPAMNQLQNFIQKDHKAFSEVMGKYLAAFSPQHLQDNAPAIIQINSENLEKGETCQVGDKIASMCESVCQKGTPCIPDHFIVLLGCDKATCDVWTWAARATVKHDVLASQTVTLIPFKPFA